MILLSRVLNALAIHVHITATIPRGLAPVLSAARGIGMRCPRFAGGIENQSDTTAAILLRFAYPFGIEGKVSIERPGKLRLDVSVVRHVERDSHRCLEIAASFAAVSR